jgi:hypothetical protein
MSSHLPDSAGDRAGAVGVADVQGLPAPPKPGRLAINDSMEKLLDAQRGGN